MIDELVELHGCSSYHDGWLLRMWVSLARRREVVARTNLASSSPARNVRRRSAAPADAIVFEVKLKSDTDGAVSTTTGTSPHAGRIRGTGPGGQLRQVSPGKCRHRRGRGARSGAAPLCRPGFSEYWAWRKRPPAEPPMEGGIDAWKARNRRWSVRSHEPCSAARQRRTAPYRPCASHRRITSSGCTRNGPAAPPGAFLAPLLILDVWTSINEG